MTWGSLLWAPITLMALGNKEFLMNITSHNIVVYWSVLMIFLSGLQVPWRQGQYFLYTLLFSSQHTITLMVCVQSLSCLTLFATPWTEARQAPLFMGLPRQKYWTGLPFPSPGNLPNPGIKPMPLTLGSWFFTIVPPGTSGSSNTFKQWTNMHRFRL